VTLNWEATYASTGEGERSWSEAVPVRSLEWIMATNVPADAPIVDIGGGASRLVDGLIDRGFTNVTVVDLSASALREAERRVGGRAHFVCADLFDWDPPQPVALWHDRAVLHFLTARAQRLAYVDHVARSVQPGGHVIVACFSPDGPERCSGLEVERASVEQLVELFGPRFELRASLTEDHVTPWGAVQSFTWVRFTHHGELHADVHE
jgi:trans-aconitate methyltransferase